MDALISKNVNEVLIVGFGGNKLLDQSDIANVSKALMATATEAEKDQKILLSFQGVSFMSSAMLGRLVMFNKKCKQQDVKLKVCSISPEIFEIFKLTKMNKMFDIYADKRRRLSHSIKRDGLGRPAFVRHHKCEP